MHNLVNEAEAEYRQLSEKPHGPVVTELRTSDFDFLTSPEMPEIPIHIIETGREEQRRNGTVDRDTSLSEFIKTIGVDEADTEDPVNGYSVLHVKESMRAYFGEQVAYRLTRQNMIRYTEDTEWLKCMTFLDGQTADECERQRSVGRKAQMPSGEEVIVPVTTYRQAFFAKKSKKVTE
ncbi:hypothetical_protein [Leishmania braziliensis MHOM/BR/75/M2904]|uniref:Hypothetical_protein n=1 Tax=Leishmania braziliensis MHOM/BR/75/M2904 TaxID=420245 RepID=A0A3P3ZEZ5_LEIBR|nr:hypothetical_protein [Leishmania braziliensis MHOM/BR/75/M2904]